MFFRSVSKYFKQGNVCVTGLRGTGKDMLFANVVARDKRPYISNVDYKAKSVYIPLDFSRLDPKNNYQQFISGDIVPYDYPYPENVDIYVSDAGVYFPSQFCNELNKAYSKMPVFQALSRQLGDCNFHVNVQNLNRCWDKIREQSDIYISCQKCVVFSNIPVIGHLPILGRLLGNTVFQSVIIYDKYQSCLDRVKPYRHMKTPFTLNSQSRAMYKSKDLELHRQFEQSFGKVRKRFIVYRNKSNYDTRLFKSILKGGATV
jgi:hypothetical protein